MKDSRFRRCTHVLILVCCYSYKLGLSELEGVDLTSLERFIVSGHSNYMDLWLILVQRVQDHLALLVCWLVC